jgi:hypothetical protein
LFTFTGISFANCSFSLILLSPDTINTRIAFPEQPNSSSSHAYFPAAVCWKGPFRHSNPTSVGIYAFDCRIRTISKPDLTRCLKAFRRGVGTYRGGIAHDRHRCTAQRLHANFLCDDCFSCGGEHILRFGAYVPSFERGTHLHLDTYQGLQLLCRSLLLCRT